MRVENCNFYGVKFDERATDAIIIVANTIKTNAEACIANAEALKSLSKVFEASNVTIESLLKMGPEEAQEKEDQDGRSNT